MEDIFITVRVWPHFVFFTGDKLETMLNEHAGAFRMELASRLAEERAKIDPIEGCECGCNICAAEKENK